MKQDKQFTVQRLWCTIPTFGFEILILDFRRASLLIHIVWGVCPTFNQCQNSYCPPYFQATVQSLWLFLLGTVEINKYDNVHCLSFIVLWFYVTKHYIYSEQYPHIAFARHRSSMVKRFVCIRAFAPSVHECPQPSTETVQKLSMLLNHNANVLHTWMNCFFVRRPNFDPV